MAQVTKTATELISLMQDSANGENSFGADFNTKENSDWYKLNRPVADLARYVLDIVQNRFDNLELRTAEDPYFFGQASNFLFERKMPDYSKCSQMEATNPVIGAYADAGQIQIKKENTDLVYVNKEPVTVDTVPFYFSAIATETGTIADADVGAVNVLQSTPSNWGDTFTNNVEFAGGQDLETIEEARKRYFNNDSIDTFWNEDGVKAAIEKLSGVKSSYIKQNRTDTTVGVIPRRAIHCVVDGGIENDIIKTIFQKVGTSTYTYGDTRQDIITLSGDTVDIGFDRPTLIETQYKITTIPVDVPTSFIDALLEYSKTIAVGGVISSDAAATYIRDNVDVAATYNSIYVSFKNTGDTDFVPAIQYGNTEKPDLIAEVI